MALDKDTLRKVLEDALPVVPGFHRDTVINRAFDHFRDDGLSAENLKSIAWVQEHTTGISRDKFDRLVRDYENGIRL